MKNLSVLLVFSILLFSSYGKIPNYLQPLLCRASDPEYEKCVWTNFEKSRPYLLKGIPELSLPPLDPFELPLMTVNRTLNEAVTINAVLRNIRMEGGRNIVINNLKANPFTHAGEIRLTIPWASLEMDYDVSGHILRLPLQSNGFFRGNFSDIHFYVKGSLTTYKKDDAEYFRVKKITSKTVVGNGWVKLIAKNPSLQVGADIISNFFNEDPKRFLDTVNPIFVDTANELYRVVSNQILANAKASEWVPK